MIRAAALVLLASRPVDFRTGALALAALAAEVLVFCTGLADRMEIVLWDRSGLVLIRKPLEGSAFRWLPIVDGAV